MNRERARGGHGEDRTSGSDATWLTAVGEAAARCRLSTAAMHAAVVLGQTPRRGCAEQPRLAFGNA